MQMQNPELKILWKYITIFYCSTNNNFFLKNWHFLQKTFVMSTFVMRIKKKSIIKYRKNERNIVSHPTSNLLPVIRIQF